MRHLFPRLLPLLLPAVLALAPVHADAEGDTPKRLPSPVTLGIKVKTTRPTYGAPIELEVALTNRSQRVLPVHCDKSALDNTSIQLTLIDKHGVVWLPVTTPRFTISYMQGEHPYQIRLIPGLGFSDNVWSIAPGKTLRFTLTLSWFRREVPLDNTPAGQMSVPGLPEGAYTVRARYEQKGISVPSAAPYWHPRLIQVEPIRPKKLVPGLYEGTLAAETTLAISAPTTVRVDALSRRVRALERQLVDTRALIQKMRELLDGKRVQVR